VRNGDLHGRLRAFAARASAHLDGLVESGLEIPYEVSESPGRTSVLYHYRPLSDRFVRERFAELRKLEGFGPAVLALSEVEGLSAYLRALGVRSVPAAERDRAEEVLRELLARGWEEVTTFELEGSHFDRAYRELESILYENSVRTTVLVPLPGVRLATERLELGAGLALARGDLCEAPPEAIWAPGREESEPSTLAVLTVEAAPKEPAPLPAARLTFRSLLTALRLFRTGAASLGTTAWWRLDDGPWQALPLGSAGHPRAGEYWLEPSDRDELAELLELVRSRPLRGGPLPWALTRFEQGCERLMPVDGLSDHLLAARALLDGDGAGPADVPSRLAALCAEPADRSGLEARVERAFLLERLVMRGELDGRSLGRVGGEPPDAIARELEEQLRAILRDMVCGYLGADVKRIADELLMAESAARPEPRIEERTPKRKEPIVESWDEILADEEPEITERAIDDEPEPEPVEGPVIRRRPPQRAKATTKRPQRAAVAQREKPKSGRKRVSKVAAEPESEQTLAVGGFDWHRDDLDWGFDDDASDFSAAV
jgi:hypothetical protein